MENSASSLKNIFGYKNTNATLQAFLQILSVSVLSCCCSFVFFFLKVFFIPSLSNCLDNKITQLLRWSSGYIASFAFFCSGRLVLIRVFSTQSTNDDIASQFTASLLDAPVSLPWQGSQAGILALICRSVKSSPEI